MAKVKKEYPAVVIVYHRIIDSNSPEFLYKSAAVHHRIKDFKKEIAFIKRWFNIISMDELINSIIQKQSFDVPSIAITFDDGYRDNYVLAYPILKMYDLPATIYTTTDLIQTNKRTWLDEIEYALLKTDVTSLEFQKELFCTSSLKEKQSANIKIAKLLKRVTNKEKSKLLAELNEKLKINKETLVGRERIMLNWQEIKEMSRHNITFGAHTQTHPILTQMPLEEAKHEIVNSKKVLENELQIAVDHFAFPNGTRADFNEDLRQFCIDAEFKSIATAEYGTNDKTSDTYHIKRAVPYAPIYVFAMELIRLIYR